MRIRQRYSDFRPVEGRFVAFVDLRKHKASALNRKCYTNATIALSRGRLPNSLLLKTNGEKVMFSVPSLDEARLVADWLQGFESNWGNSNL